MDRRHLLTGAASIGIVSLAAPSLAQRSQANTLKFIPQADLSLLDPIQTAALVTRNHAALVYDTLYGVDSGYVAHPQMVEGHVIEDDGRTWTLTLRSGLVFHDNMPVLARDAVASLRRWARKDAYGDALLKNSDELTALDDRRIRFRLKRPMPNLPYILGKEGPYLAAIMPERLAETDAFRAVPEIVGSGPYRFVRDERMAGARNVYSRWERYVPRDSGPSSVLAGPKIAHIERVEWHTMPDASTASAAMQAGEMDWWELPTVDLLPRLRRVSALQVNLLQTAGAMGVMKINHLFPPFDNPAVRRAIWPALQQSEFLAAARGDDPAGWQEGVGFFLPGTPMANDAGLEAITAPRNLELAKRLLRESGYKGEPVALLIPTDFPELNAFSAVTGSLLEAIGFKVDRQNLDWGTVVQRIITQKPVNEGGWNIFCTFLPGAYTIDPAVNWYMRGNGRSGGVGWPTSDKLEALRNQWLDTANLAEQQALCRGMQTEALDNVTYVPLGRFYQPTVYNRRVTGFSPGFPTFYNLRKA
jgi:peptide/nickel transport system substrate-binding protein